MLDAIQARLTAAEAGGYRSFPWRPIINTAGDRHGVAELLAHAPADIAKLVKALRAVEAVHFQSTDHRFALDAYCRGCYEACGYDAAPLWPCPTITAIREALG